MLRGIFGSGGGAAVGGTGTTNTIPRWTGPSTLGDSGFVDDGSTIAAASRMLAIGTSSTTGARVWIQNNSSGNTLVLVSPSGAGSAFGQLIEAGTNASDYALNVRQRGTANPLVYVRGDGNVGIGTASPAYKLDVVGAPNAVGAAISTTYGTATTVYSAFRFNNTGLAYGNSEIRNYVDGSTSLGSNLALFTSQVGTGTLTERVRVDQSGNLILNSANTGATIQAAGTSQGLKLQGTGGTNNTDPNVLDFYADGGTANSGGVAWTPTLKFGGNTTGITYNTQMGRYTRIGNMVFASCYIRLTSKGTATGAATIDGLPTCVNLAGFYAAGAIGYTAAITSTGTMQINMLANQTQLTIRQVTAVGVNTAVTDTDFANGSEIIVSISYPVN